MIMLPYILLLGTTMAAVALTPSSSSLSSSSNDTLVATAKSFKDEEAPQTNISASGTDDFSTDRVPTAPSSTVGYTVSQEVVPVTTVFETQTSTIRSLTQAVNPAGLQTPREKEGNTNIPPTEAAEPETNVISTTSETLHLTVISSSTTAPISVSSVTLQQNKSYTIVISKETSVTANLPKLPRKPSPSPGAVSAKRCCEDGDLLRENRCEASPNQLIFSPTGFENDSISYSWETFMPICSEGFKLQEFFLDGKEASLNADKNKSFVKWDTGAVFKTTSKYCIGQKTNNISTALVCVHDIQSLCEDDVCVTKCCGDKEVISGFSCELNTTRIFTPTFYTIQGKSTTTPKGYKLISRVPNCIQGTLTFKVTSMDSVFLLSTGKLYVKDSGTSHDNTDYCLDNFLGDDQVVAYYCVDHPSQVQQFKKKFIPFGMGISIVFLLITILCHMVTPELRNAQGYYFFAYSKTLLMSYIGFIVNFMYTKVMSSLHCVFTGLFNQFALLSAFCWLCVMCFDIWRVIKSSIKCVSLPDILEKDKEKILYYSTFAYGCPLLITMVTLTMQYIPEQYSSGLIVPGFLKESCWFADDLSQFLYLYLFIALLNVISLAVLGHILYMLSKAEQGISCFFQNPGTSRAFNRKHMSIFRQRLILFSVMVFCWFMEVVSLEIKPKELWIVTDILNTLQGLIVFIIFLFSKKKRHQIMEAFKTNVRKIYDMLKKSISRDRDTLDSSNGNGTDMTDLTSLSQRPPIKETTKSVMGKKKQKEGGGLGGGGGERKGKDITRGIQNMGFNHQDDDGFV